MAVRRITRGRDSGTCIPINQPMPRVARQTVENERTVHHDSRTEFRGWRRSRFGLMRAVSSPHQVMSGASSSRAPQRCSSCRAAIRIVATADTTSRRRCLAPSLKSDEPSAELTPAMDGSAIVAANARSDSDARPSTWQARTLRPGNQATSSQGAVRAQGGEATKRNAPDP